MAFTLSTTINEQQDVVRRHFADRNGWLAWFCQAAEVDPREGGTLTLAWPAENQAVLGEYTSLDKSRISMIWCSLPDANPTEVTVQLSEVDGATTVEVTYDDQTFTHAWEEGLANLKHRLEEGPDLRLVNRPILGIFPVRVANAADGLPVEGGIVISGVAPNTGAEAAGLQPEDIVYSLGGVVLQAFASFGPAMRGRQAGDEVEVVYYRAGEKHTVTMTLSPSQIPDVPAEPARLAAQVAKGYSQALGRIANALQAAEPGQAAARPTLEEWSANHILAHLIHTERWLHQSILSTVHNGYPATFGPNDAFQLETVLAAYPTSETLLAELKTAAKQTEAMLRALEVDKARLWNIGQNALGLIGHVDGHADQIEEALTVLDGEAAVT